jgi:hypothetical protein
MEHLRWIGFGAFFVSSLVIGVRLLMLARRTGQIPELLIGLGVLGIGPLGYGLTMLAFGVAGRFTILGATLMGSGSLAVFIGAVSQYLFVWYVFRRRARWARPVVYLAIALLAASYAGDILEYGLVNRARGGAWFWLGMGLRIFVLGWSSLESLLYWRRMRRRWHLGLADAVVRNRFLLWGVGAGSACIGSSVGAAVALLTGASSSSYPAAHLLLSAFGLVAAVAMWLAFQPPARYVRRVRARAHAGIAP